MDRSSFQNWTSKPQVFLSDPSFQPRFGASSSKWKPDCEGQSGRADLWILHASVHVTLGCALLTSAEIRVGTLRRDSCPKQILNGEFRVCCRSGQQDEEREYFLHFKEKQKKHVLHNTGTRDVRWHKLWYAAMLLHCRHSQIAQSSHFLNSRQSSSAVAQRLTHSSHGVQTHVNQASRQEVCLSKRYKAGLPCTSCDVWGNTLSDVLNGC